MRLNYILFSFLPALHTVYRKREKKLNLIFSLELQFLRFLSELGFGGRKALR